MEQPSQVDSLGILTDVSATLVEITTLQHRFPKGTCPQQADGEMATTP